MSDAKKRKKMRKCLLTLTRAQLVALGAQKTEIAYKSLLTMSPAELVEVLVNVDDVLKPVAV